MKPIKMNAIQYTFNQMTRDTKWKTMGNVDEETDKYENWYLVFCWHCNTPVEWRNRNNAENWFCSVDIDCGSPYPNEFDTTWKRYKYEPNSPLCCRCAELDEDAY